MNRFVTVLMLLTMLATGGITGIDGARAGQDTTRMQTQTFKVENMTCALCPITVRKAMEGVEGVKSVEVDLEAKTATVVFDPAAATLDAIAQASTNAGYPAKAMAKDG